MEPTPKSWTFLPIILEDPTPEGVRVDEPGLLANFYRAQHNERAPALIVIGGSEGGLGAAVSRQARSLQAQGFHVLHVCYFGGHDQPETLACVSLESFTRALDWLEAQPDVPRGRIGFIGGSKGAEAALLVAAHDPRVQAVVAGMPSSVVWPGIRWSGRTPPPSWTLRGEPVDYLPFISGPYISIFDVYERSLEGKDLYPSAIIPVEKINGPVMLIDGRLDSLWPASQMADQIEHRCATYAFRHPVERCSYGEAGHAVFGPPWDESDENFSRLGDLGGTPMGNNAARRESWSRMISFLSRSFRL